MIRTRKLWEKRKINLTSLETLLINNVIVRRFFSLMRRSGQNYTFSWTFFFLFYYTCLRARRTFLTTVMTLLFCISCYKVSLLFRFVCYLKCYEKYVVFFCFCFFQIWKMNVICFKSDVRFQLKISIYNFVFWVHL